MGAAQGRELWQALLLEQTHFQYCLEAAAWRQGRVGRRKGWGGRDLVLAQGHACLHVCPPTSSWVRSCTASPERYTNTGRAAHVPVTMQRQVPAVLRVRHPSVSVHRQIVGHSCYALETGIRSATVQVRGAHRAPVMDVPVIIQLQFLLSFQNVVVPQIPFLDTVLQLQLCFRGVYAQCKLCNSRRFPPCSSSTLFTCPLLCVDRCRRWSRQCRKS